MYYCKLWAGLSFLEKSLSPSPQALLFFRYVTCLGCSQLCSRLGGSHETHRLYYSCQGPTTIVVKSMNSAFNIHMSHPLEDDSMCHGVRLSRCTMEDAKD